MKFYFVLIATLIALSSCQTMYVPQARDVKKKPRQGGIIAMNTKYRAEDRQQAESMMQSNCGPLAVNILEEGEIVTGHETKTTSNETNRDDTRKSQGHLFGIPVISGSASGKETAQSSSTTQLKEWQISYECQNDKTRKR